MDNPRHEQQLPLSTSQSRLETEISNLKAFGDLCKHDFTLIAFFHNSGITINFQKNLWPAVKNICEKWKCDQDKFTRLVGIPKKFGGSVMVFTQLDPAFGAELVASFIKKTIGIKENSKYPEIMCSPLKILVKYRKYQMRKFSEHSKLNYIAKQQSAKNKDQHLDEKQIVTKKTKEEKQSEQQKVSTGEFSNEERDNIVVTVSIAHPLTRTTEKVEYLPKKNVLKRRKIGRAPNIGTKAYTKWYNAKFPPLPKNNPNKM